MEDNDVDNDYVVLPIEHYDNDDDVIYHLNHEVDSFGLQLSE